MTNTWQDIKNANVVIVMGGNAAEAHPCGFKWVIEAKHHNKAKLVVVDPRFTRSAAMADYYAPIRAGSDIAFLGGVGGLLLGCAIALLREGGVFVVEHHHKNALPEESGRLRRWRVLKQGDSALSFYEAA